MHQSRLALLLACAASVLLVVAACGGSDDKPTVSLAAGAVGCEQTLNDSYQYLVQVDQDVGPMPTGEPTPTGVGRAPFHFTQVIKGMVQDGVKLQATIDNTDGHNKAHYDAIQIGDTGYLNFPDQGGWEANDTSVRRIPFPYWPMSICQSIVPDIDTTKLGQPESEELNGVDTDRYTVSDLGAKFFDRSPDFGAGSDMGSYINNLGGTVWIAKDGRYPAKFDLSGQGPYPSGQILSVQIQFEAWDFKSDISISAPPLGTATSGS